ncbi:MAG TPA: choice-of-anchor I family protein, partial [Phnomibacter sp.]|nr:choice-of-anchor I family protein [Phnomibacter sp.]
IWLAGAILVLASCSKQDMYEKTGDNDINALAKKEGTFFSEISNIDLGGVGAAEISAFDPATKRLFVVNNDGNNNRIDVLDFSDPANPVKIHEIPVAPFGGIINSVAVSDGKLAGAIQASIKTMPGKVVVFATADHSVIREVTVGALPDMVTFSPDGNYIVTADEGEPDNYLPNNSNPEGTVSIIEVNRGYAVTTLNFAKFEAQKDALMAKGLRVFGPGATFAQDMEPEYVTISSNSRTAWVSLQENNAIAKVDLRTRTITDLFPLGFKDYSKPGNEMDLSDLDGSYGNFKKWPVYGIYQPDAIVVSERNGAPFIFSANEGDSRSAEDFPGYEELVRVNNGSVVLEPTVFDPAFAWKNNANLGRLNITNTLGRDPATGRYTGLYSLGGRSFSIWNGNTGEQIFDSGNELDRKAVMAFNAGLGPNIDNRSDDKGIEPEGLALGRVGNRNLLFVGLERANAVAIYNVTDIERPQFLQWLPSGERPEGVLFISADKSPNGKSLLVVSSENDGTVRTYTTQ